jgi:glycosyltransferase involved in cell wall biosynthesis
MKRVLFIAYPFPPRGGGGVQRSVKFVKYLPAEGWLPTVMSGPHRQGASSDPTLRLEVPNEVDIVSIHGIELPEQLPWRLRKTFTRWFLIVDGQVGWWPAAVRRGRELVQNWRFSAIYSTSAPYTDHLVAMQLQRESRLSWVADFRDPWLDNFNTKFATRWHRNLCSRLERKILERAERVIVVSTPMRDQLVRRYGSLARGKVIIVPNGFDRADFDNATARVYPKQSFNITYTGSLYGKQSIRTFLLAMRQLLDDEQIDRSTFKLYIVGNSGKETRGLVQELRLADCVELVGYVSHGEAISLQLGADALLLIVSSEPGSDAVATGKIYEYLAAGKPILGLVPAGVAADLLVEANAGVVVDPDNVDKIASRLRDLYEVWRAGGIDYNANKDVVARYERRQQAKKLAATLEDITD